MHWTGFMRRTILKRTLQIFGVIVLTILLSFGFVYYQATSYMVAQLDALVTQEANFIAGEARQGRLESFQERLRQDPRRVKPTGLFDAERNRLAGNIESLPSGLHVDGAPRMLRLSASAPPSARKNASAPLHAGYRTDRRLLWRGVPITTSKPLRS
jgi:hypothetical protein